MTLRCRRPFPVTLHEQHVATARTVSGFVGMIFRRPTVLQLPAPATLAATKTALLLDAFGPTEADVIAQFLAQS